jgi:hypothetical protein
MRSASFYAGMVFNDALTDGFSALMYFIRSEGFNTQEPAHRFAGEL